MQLPLSYLCLALLAGHAASAQEPAAASPASLDEGNFTAWRDRILPDESELGWEKIPWLTSFGEGVHEASRRERPLLLWMMNGHPLGCT